MQPWPKKLSTKSGEVSVKLHFAPGVVLASLELDRVNGVDHCGFAVYEEPGKLASFLREVADALEEEHGRRGCEQAQVVEYRGRG